VLKAVLNFALDKEMIERNPMTGFRPYEGRGERAVKRGAFEEAEVRALLSAARPQERALIGLLCFTGLRPGEAFALRWQDLDLEAGTALVTRNWDHRGKEVYRAEDCGRESYRRAVRLGCGGAQSSPGPWRG
jgi:integrase